MTWRIKTYYTDELRQRHLNGNGDLLALVDGWSDQFVVTLRAQQIVYQSLLCILCSAAYKCARKWW